MRYTGKDSKNALKVRAQCFGVCFLLFNKAIPSFHITSVKVLGEKEEPQHFYNKGFFYWQEATCAAGELLQGICKSEASCSPALQPRDVTKACMGGN